MCRDNIVYADTSRVAVDNQLSTNNYSGESNAVGNLLVDADSLIYYYNQSRDIKSKFIQVDVVYRDFSIRWHSNRIVSVYQFVYTNHNDI